MRLRALFALAGLTALLALPATAAAPAADWPQVAAPPGAEIFDIAPDAVINGIPTRISGFRSAQSPEQVTAWLLRHAGHKLAKTSLGKARVLGYRVDAHYVTLQLSSLAAAQGTGDGGGAEGTHGVVSITRRTSAEDQSRHLAMLERWSNLLPPQTKVVTHMTFTDNGYQSTLMTLTSQHSAALNRSHLTELLKHQGFQREAQQAPSNAKSPNNIRSDSGYGTQADWFHSAHAGEALLTTSAGSDGNTRMVLNIVERLDRFKP